MAGVTDTLQLSSPKSYNRYKVNVLMSQASGATARKIFGQMPLYEFVFALPDDCGSEDWPRLLVEGHSDGGQWLQGSTLITPEVSSRWSLFSFVTLIAASVGFPVGWVLRFGEDTTQHSVTQEQSACLEAGSKFPWQQGSAVQGPPEDARMVAQRIKLLAAVECLRESEQHNLFLAVRGEDAPTTVKKQGQIEWKDIAGVVPAYFAAPSSLQLPPRQKPVARSDTCVFSGYNFSVEAAHLFDANLPTKLIFSLLEVSGKVGFLGISCVSDALITCNSCAK